MHMSPFGVVPSRAVYDARLSHAVFRVLAALTTYADRNRVCYPKEEELADRLHVTQPAINKSVRQLVTLGYLAREKRRNERGHLISSRYRILFDQADMPEEVPIQPEVVQDESYITSGYAGTEPIQPQKLYRDESYITSRTSLYNLAYQPCITSEVIQADTAPAQAGSGAATPEKQAEQTTINRPLITDHSSSAAEPPSLMREVAEAAGLTSYNPQYLKRIITRFAANGDAWLIDEAFNAAEWIADPRRNPKHATMNLGFLGRWFNRVSHEGQHDQLQQQQPNTPQPSRRSPYPHQRNHPPSYPAVGHLTPEDLARYKHIRSTPEPQAS